VAAQTVKAVDVLPDIIDAVAKPEMTTKERIEKTRALLRKQRKMQRDLKKLNDILSKL
jgi:hypothetical protein